MFIYTPITTCIIKKIQMQSIQTPGIFKFMIDSATKNNKIKDSTNIAYHIHTSFYTPAPRRGRGIYCFTSARPSSVHPRYFSQQLSMAEI